MQKKKKKKKREREREREREKTLGKLKAFYLFHSLLEVSTVDRNHCNVQSFGPSGSLIFRN